MITVGFCMGLIVLEPLASSVASLWLVPQSQVTSVKALGPIQITRIDPWEPQLRNRTYGAVGPYADFCPDIVPRWVMCVQRLFHSHDTHRAGQCCRLVHWPNAIVDRVADQRMTRVVNFSPLSSTL